MKATTWIDLINRALSRLGVDMIAALNDGSRQANVAALYYLAVYRSLLGAADWSFARKRAELPRLAQVPASGFAYAYPLPPDYIRLAWRNRDDGGIEPDVESQGYPIREEGQTILSDSDSLSIAYIASQDTPRAHPEHFNEAYVAALAQTLGTTLVQSDALRGVLLVEAERARSKSIEANALTLPEPSPGTYSYEAR